MSNEESVPRNRRRARRVTARIRILFTRAGTSIAIEAESDDISLDGVFVRTQRRPPDIGTKLGLILKLEEPLPDLMLSGVVARVRDENGDTSPGMGIRFVDLDGDKREMLLRFLEGTGEYPAEGRADG